MCTFRVLLSPPLPFLWTTFLHTRAPIVGLREGIYVFIKLYVCLGMYLKRRPAWLDAWSATVKNEIQLSATDLLALASMKNAANCDK
jgi:hypothetical protein